LPKFRNPFHNGLSVEHGTKSVEGALIRDDGFAGDILQVFPLLQEL
jgi:hypothetical protein